MNMTLPRGRFIRLMWLGGSQPIFVNAWSIGTIHVLDVGRVRVITWKEPRHKIY